MNPPLFFPDPKISLSTQGNRICQSTPSDGIRIHFRETRPTSCAAILVYCSVRDWTPFCYVIGVENIQIRRPHVIGFVADLSFSSLESGLKKYPDSLSNSPNACGRKPYPERKSCGLKNIRILVDGVLL